jgi:hypothetical protein
MGSKVRLVERLLFSANDRSCVRSFLSHSSENIQDEELAVFYKTMEFVPLLLRI